MIAASDKKQTAIIDWYSAAIQYILPYFSKSSQKPTDYNKATEDQRILLLIIHESIITVSRGKKKQKLCSINCPDNWKCALPLSGEFLIKEHEQNFKTLSTNINTSKDFSDLRKASLYVHIRKNPAPSQCQAAWISYEAFYGDPTPPFSTRTVFEIRRKCAAIYCRFRLLQSFCLTQSFLSALSNCIFLVWKRFCEFARILECRIQILEQSLRCLACQQWGAAGKRIRADLVFKFYWWYALHSWKLKPLMFCWWRKTSAQRWFKSTRCSKWFIRATVVVILKL